jgi:hypothetical protein
MDGFKMILLFLLLGVHDISIINLLNYNYSIIYIYEKGFRTSILQANNKEQGGKQHRTEKYRRKDIFEKSGSRNSLISVEYQRINWGNSPINAVAERSLPAKQRH